MKSNKTHILLLALFHLLVFIIPITIKSGHQHLQRQYAQHSLQGKVISNAKESCPICKFEFVHILTHTIRPEPFFQFSQPLLNTVLVSAVYNYAFTSFSHRAPPVS